MKKHNLISKLDLLQEQRYSIPDIKLQDKDKDKDKEKNKDKYSWQQLRNSLTMCYNSQVSFYNPEIMKKGELEDDTNDHTMSNISQEPPKKRRKVHVEISTLASLQDLIDLIDTYPYDPFIKYDIDLSKIYNISQPLRELNSMIGLEELKKTLVDQILYFAQDLHKSPGGSDTMDYMHTVLYGPPGTGKTEVAMLMGKIYAAMGILKKETFNKVTRSDLVAGYLGQTAIKTKKVITNSLDGVLFIDEAYSLGNSEKRDSFAQECIDTICECASFYKDRLVIIIAGYEDELKTRFFAWNNGLESRFPWRHKTSEYDPVELSYIFRKMVNDSRWNLMMATSTSEAWFTDNKDQFKFFGRDMETLFSKVKIGHAHRVFGMRKYAKRNVTKADLEDGLKRFIANKHSTEKDDKMKDEILSTIYT